MKVTLIYGDNIDASSRRALHIIETVKKRGWDVDTIQKDSQSLAEKLRKISLFEENKLFVIESVNVLTQTDVEWLKKNQQRVNSNLLIRINGDLPKKLANVFGKDIKLEEYKLPQKLFIFLESISPGNSLKSITLFHDVLQAEPVELIIAMIATQIRDVYWVKCDISSYKAPSWKISKLTAQGSKFSKEALEEFIRDLADIDIKVKTTQIDLRRELDLLLARTLQ